MNFKRVLTHLAAPPWLLRRVFTPANLAAIESAITTSEKLHLGQIRFAIEETLDWAALWHDKSARERAIEVFSSLRVWDTEQNNGVLIYLLLADHDVEIVADRGIHRLAGEAAWEAICRRMEASLRAGDFERAVVSGIEDISALLITHYPRRDAGANELPDAPIVL